MTMGAGDSEDRFNRIYERVVGIVKFLAYRYRTDHPLMDRSELEGELLLEVYRVFLYYDSSLENDDELVSVIKRSLDNRLSDLRYKYFVTFRKNEHEYRSIEDLNHDEYEDDSLSDTSSECHLLPYCDSIELYDSATRVEEFIETLDADEISVVRAILADDPRIEQQMRLLEMRKSTVYDVPTVRPSYREIADALHMDTKKAYRVWYSIRDKWNHTERYIRRMALTKSDVLKRFGKDDILAACGELEISLDPSTNAFTAIDFIYKDMDENGVPEADDMSDVLFDLLVAMSIIDENGDLVEIGDEDKEVKELPESLPECWGCADEDNVACKRCACLTKCVEERQRVLSTMNCFGVLYDPKTKECKMCIYWRMCKRELEGSAV